MTTDNSRHRENGFCPVCGSKKSEKIFSHARLANIKRTYATKESAKKLMADFDTNLCMVCGMLYRLPPMSEEQLNQYYSREYYETYNLGLKDEDNGPYIQRLRSWKTRYIRYFRFLAKNKVSLSGKRVLDVGCGRGYFLSVARENGASVCLGIESSRQCCERIKNSKEHDFEVMNKCIRDVCREEAGVFDFVACIGVLEHLSQPLLDLEICRNLMDDDALMYIYSHNETPNLFTDIRKRISLVHQLYFTERTVRILLERVGLQIVSLETRNTDMHILVKKCAPVCPNHKLSWLRYNILKARYLVCKKIPPGYFSIASWFYLKYLALRDRVRYRKITPILG